MKKVALVLALILCCALAAPAMAAEVVNVYNWGDYICPEALELFTQETGINVNYMYFTTNEDMMVKIRTDVGAFDVVFPSDYCIERLIAEGLLAEIDYSQIPNYKSIDEQFKDLPYDPMGVHSVPYMWGTVGILYDTTKVDGEITSWGALFDEKYKGEVIMYDSIRDTFGLALKYLGYSMNTSDPVALNAATQLLIKQKKDGIVKAYQGDEIKVAMAAGEATMAVNYSGDALNAMSQNENLEYVVPEEGSNIWVDGMVVPASAKNYDNAMKFIDFMCRPDIAQLNCEYIWYSSPNADAIELMGADYIDDEDINPPDEIKDNCEFFHDINDVIAIYTTLWTQVKNAK